MKKTRRAVCLCIVAMLLFCVCCSATEISAKTKSTTKTPKEVAKYIKKNTKKFAKAYNKTISKPSEKFHATSVEKQ